jgi:hypothetical protein
MMAVREAHAATRHAFLVGTPFCGSTVFGQALDIGGNYSARAVAREASAEFSREEFRNRLPGGLAPFMEAAESYWGKPFGGWVDDKWHRNMTEDDIEFVLQTPGLVDVANLLGYELSKDVLAWERHRAAAG